MPSSVNPEVGIGIVPGGGGTERLPRAIGRDRAFEAILTSVDYDAAIAERWGWVTRALRRGNSALWCVAPFTVESGMDA